MQMKKRLVAGVFCGLAGLISFAAPQDRFNVVWDSPSVNQHGSMPLGNGDVALNAWATRDGNLHFTISKTDSWDDNARLLKVGKVRVHFDPNPFADGQPFKQTLSLNDGTVCVEAGEGARRTRIALWVDALHPVVQVTAESAAPLEATAFVELWRTNRQELAELQCSDVLNQDPKKTPMVTEPDTLLAYRDNRVGWLHHNVKSVGPQLLAEIQGITGYNQADPLLHRTFGAVVTAAGGTRLDDLRLRSPRGTSHRFSVFVLTRHPATPEQWRSAMDDAIGQVEKQDMAARRAAHERWWGAFWERSWIRATVDPDAPATVASIAPTNAHPLRVGMDQAGSNRYLGELGRVSVFGRALSGAEIAALTQGARNQALAGQPGLLFSGAELKPQELSNSVGWNLASGVTLEAWIKPQKLVEGGARIVDKITPGSSDGFLFDTYPGNSLRWICGQNTLLQKDVLPVEQWTHVAAVADAAASGLSLYVNGKLVDSNASAVVRDEAAYVSQMYHLQRFITACAGRGAYPIKFNGSLFTVSPGADESDPDYRRWGSGYWWQNTRLPYISLCATGDFDLIRPLFRMYADEFLPLCKYRTKHYLGHDGAFYPECVYFWGPMFSETYGWTPYEKRQDKLQESGWHKWEWVGGLELCWMMLDVYEHTLDREFLKKTALPFIHEILTFFDQHYPVNAQGKLVMHPSQALETWWSCTNAAPELAGCVAVAERLLALPPDLPSATEHEFWQRFRDKLPPMPVRVADGKTALAPAEFYARKSNCENPELYSVFPFRLFAFNRPHPEWALAALEHRWDRGNSGWRQDDIFMAYLGLTNDVRKALVERARSHDRNERFPAFWGPNYDWTPDQDHGGVMMKAFQSMLLQTDGQRIFLLPAWPKEWDVEFKLHAPQQTEVEGVYLKGKMVALRVTPEARRKDVECGIALP